MMQVAKQTLPNTRELVLYWTAGASIRCVLVNEKDRLNLQILRQQEVVRGMPNVDPRNARDIARQWQVDYELTCDPAPDAIADPPCPACGDHASPAYAIHKGREQRACRTCGHDWSIPCR